MGCEEGRSSESWVDFDFFGHQIVAHVAHVGDRTHNEVDGHSVQVPHFGVVLKWNEWHKLADELTSKNVQFAIEPYTRFDGQPGEQATMFVIDPSGNALEFKAFRDPSKLFATD